MKCEKKKSLFRLWDNQFYGVNVTKSNLFLLKYVYLLYERNYLYYYFNIPAIILLLDEK